MQTRPTVHRLKRGIPLFIACLLCLYAHAQTVYMDSIRTRLRSEGPTTTRVDLLNALGMMMSGTENDTTCLVLLDEARALSRSLHYPLGLAYAPCADAVRAQNRGDHVAAIKHWKEAIDALDALHVVQGLESPLAIIRVAYNGAGLQEERLAFFQAAIERYERTGPRENLGACYHGLGGYYLVSNQYGLAIENYLKAREIFQGFDPVGALNETHVIGRAYRIWGNPDRAAPFLREALEGHLRLRDTVATLEVNVEIGEVELLRGDTAAALRQLQSTEPFWIRVPPLQTAVCRTRLAMIHIWTGDMEKARVEIDAINAIASGTHLPLSSTAQTCEVDYCNHLYQRAIGEQAAADRHLEQALAAALALHDLDFIMKYRLELSHRYRESGGYERAMEQSMAYAHLNDSLKAITNKGALAAYESTVQERQSALEIERQQAHIRQQRIVLFAVAGGVLLLLALGYSVYRGKKRSDELLLNILPAEVAKELKASGTAEARHFDKATILFTDFKGFTEASEKLSPQELVEELNTCFKAFDHIITARGIEKIKTIGDAYMCAGGLPVPASSTPAGVVHAALEMQAFMRSRKKERDAQGLPAFEMRVGIHTGPVVAGIVGVKKFQYDIWGDTVNTASRMESSGEVGQVNISEATYALVREVKEVVPLHLARGDQGREVNAFGFTPRGKVQAKGKGEMEMYFVRRMVDPDRSHE